MAFLHGGQLVGKIFKHHGVEVVFTLCGGHVSPIYEGCIEQGIKVIDVRHEQAAAHAADGWARLTRKPGVAIVTAGPGVTDAITGVVNAQQSESPILLIGGQAPMSQRERGSLQEINHIEFLRPGTKWAITVFETARLPEYLHKAFRIMTSGVQGPVFMEMPVDTLLGTADDEELHLPEPARTTYLQADDPALVEKAARALEGAKKPMIMAGSTVYWHEAWGELAQLAEKGRVPVYLNSMGRGSLPAGHPYFFQYTRKFAFKNADCILIIGSPVDFRLGYGKGFNKDAFLIQLDQDAAALGGNKKADIELIGNTKAVLGQLLDALSKPSGSKESGWLDEVKAEETKVWEGMQEGMHSEAVPIHPLRFAREVADFCDSDTLVIGDGGNIVATSSKVIPVNQPGHWLDPGKFGCLGVGVPFALSARLAYPDKKILLIMGDGTVGFNGFEFDTAVRHNLPFVSVVGNDAAWAQIRGLQLAFVPPEKAVATKLNPTRYDKVVEALGGYGEHVERPGDIRPALERAYQSGLPSLVNVNIDADLNAATYSYSAMGM